MYRSSDLTDEPSRFRQFSWEQWEDQQFAVLFRPGTYGLDRYVVKRYAELVLAQSDRWKQLSLYFGNITPPLRTYTMTSYEAELMQKILDFHLNSKLHLRVTTTNDQLVEYEDLLDFVRRLQSYAYTSSNSSSSLRQAAAKKTSTPSIPSIHTSYVLPPSAKSLVPAASQSTTSKTSPMKPILAKPAAPPTSTVPTQSNKAAYSSSQVNGNGAPPSIVDPSSRFASSVHVKPDLISPPGTHPTSSSNQCSLSSTVELSPSALYHAKVDGSGWVQINNVFLPFIIKSRQRLIPYQVLVSCKILEIDELRAALARATLADVTLMNRMIRDCKINNEEIVENAPLINVHHVLVGTKNLVYVKILPKDNPTSKINRQYKTVLALRGGSLCITNRTLPFVCSSNHSYIPLHDVLSIYPYLHPQLKPLARVPRTHELDFLQLVQMYYDERDLPSDTLLIDMDDLNQRQIIPSKNITLAEHHAREKSKLEQQIVLWTSAATASANKRKNPEPHENRPAQGKFKSSPAPTSSAFVRPPTGYFPAQPPPPSSASASSSAQYQQNQWVSSNNGQNGRTRWQ